MSGAAIALLVCAILVVWGGLVLSIVAVARRPERSDYPAGGLEDDREDGGVSPRDT
ncbi:hypothetical protein DNL40_09610 [Xylanimonas oleitrophica]|uniref:Methionine/alanine import family NSS transporter small subunit n=1 Tax=Xylanimonas oleitrophica TaxID=2607479 RepID=A0A2W5WYK6_9MICO|nr:methionine/alanine import family NSS transporter small subunit [Xylanimonas oleitrophica]PZR52905.1 hypothetical protein DNL40_09610 [Xylanimonas oleitrophica]